jgi:hypothetical protein
MAELKTKPTDSSVSGFLDAIKDDQRRQDCYTILALMQKATRAEPKMWGSSIVGFGDTHYTYASGREGDWFVAGFAPRKQNLSLYLMGGLESHAALLHKLGKHKTGKGCLYINKLQDVDMAILRKLIDQTVKQARKANRN